MPGLFDQAMDDGPHRYARVALERGLDKPDGLTYRIPSELDDLAVGDRVLVPLGSADRSVGGIVLAIEDQTSLDPLRLKAILSRDRAAAPASHSAMSRTEEPIQPGPVFLLL